jgi:hypothetical protein
MSSVAGWLDDFAEAKRGKATQQFAEDNSAFRRIARFVFCDRLREMTAKAESRRSPLTSNRATTVRVTVLHEDMSSALRAKSLADCVTAHALSGVKIKFDFWDFEFLRDAALRSKAAELSRQSAIVIVSARSPVALPWELECCIADWLQFPTRKSRAFAVLFGATEAYSSRTRALVSYWSSAAKAVGLDFFCEIPAPDIRDTTVTRPCRLNQQSALKAIGLVAANRQRAKRKCPKSVKGKMQYASDGVASPAHCNTLKINVIEKTPVFSGDRRPI